MVRLDERGEATSLACRGKLARIFSKERVRVETHEAKAECVRAQVLRAHTAKNCHTGIKELAGDTGRCTRAFSYVVRWHSGPTPQKISSSNGVARTVPESLLADHEAPPEVLPTSAATRTAFLTPGAGTMRALHRVKTVQRARSARWRSKSGAP